MHHSLPLKAGHLLLQNPESARESIINMKKIFRRARRSSTNDADTSKPSTPHSRAVVGVSNENLSPQSSHRHLHPSSSAPHTQINTEPDNTTPDVDREHDLIQDDRIALLNEYTFAEPGQYNDDVASLISTPLSDTGTLYNTNQERLNLQQTYQQNFTSYLPFLVRRMRAELNGTIPTNGTGNQPHGSTQSRRVYQSQSLSSSQETITSSQQKYSIMGKLCLRFATKRDIVQVHEIFKSHSIAFISSAEFGLFNRIRSSKEKGVPLEYRERGKGLPFLKAQLHLYIRDDGADISFDRFYESPPIVAPPQISPKSYRFCSVVTKTTTSVKRLMFTFNPEGAESFKVIMFQHTFKPIADFVYKGTRFRIFGNCLMSIGLLPNFKLLILDDSQPSLCDDIVDKPQFKIQNIIRKRRPLQTGERRGSTGLVLSQRGTLIAEDEIISDDNRIIMGITKEVDAMNNPFPSPELPLMRLDQKQFILQYKGYISNQLPPFGAATDALVYNNRSSGLIPKKFREQLKFELYQDLDSLGGLEPDSTLSLDQDTLVLLCIAFAISDTIMKRNLKATQNIDMYNRYQWAGSVGDTSGGAGLFGFL